MPSENKTLNLGLNLWEGNEYVKRQDFVEDNYKIDQGFENLKNKIGSLENLATEEKSDLVGAINEIENAVKTHLADDVTDEGGVHGLEVEVGTFTPNLSTTNRDGNATYSGTRYGNYVRIGNLVHVNIRFDVASFTGGTGYYAITGIPFPSFPPGISRYNYLLAAHNLPGASNAWYTLGSYIMPATISGTGAVPAEDFTSIKYIHISGVYQIA